MKKHLTILCDGMADYKDERGFTPMSEADKPMMNFLAENGEVGLCQTVPKGMKPGSDVANLSVMGYDPKIYYTGRSPLEALSIGVKMQLSDVTYRCNLVTLSNEPEYADKIMVDYSAGEVSTEEASELIMYLKYALPLDGLELYCGVSYRHCLLRTDGELGAILTPPHDISDKRIGDHLPKGAYDLQLNELMRLSYEALKDHPINKKRIAEGKHPANSIWLWGEGRKPDLKSFKELRGMHGAVISAVDLVKGIGMGADMQIIDVKGATGNIDTNFEGKAQAAIDALNDNDYVYVHIEAPDECGHQGNYALKKLAIEYIDKRVITPIYNYLKNSGKKYNILILPDHATPVSLKTHTSDPVPYILFDSEGKTKSGVKNFSEQTAKEQKFIVESGCALMERQLSKNSRSR